MHFLHENKISEKYKMDVLAHPLTSEELRSLWLVCLTRKMKWIRPVLLVTPSPGLTKSDYYDGRSYEASSIHSWTGRYAEWYTCDRTWIRFIYNEWILKAYVSFRSSFAHPQPQPSSKITGFYCGLSSAPILMHSGQEELIYMRIGVRGTLPHYRNLFL